jgi:poly(3-hydroxybutyrate) depolymerase
MTMSSSSTSATRAKSKTAPPSGPKHVTVQDIEFDSNALGRTTKYRIVLPSGYGESAHRYPALFLLHGVFGGSENWETLTDLTLAIPGM